MGKKTPPVSPTISSGDQSSASSTEKTPTTSLSSLSPGADSASILDPVNAKVEMVDDEVGEVFHPPIVLEITEEDKDNGMHGASILLETGPLTGDLEAIGAQSCHQVIETNTTSWEKGDKATSKQPVPFGNLSDAIPSRTNVAMTAQQPVSPPVIGQIIRTSSVSPDTKLWKTPRGYKRYRSTDTDECCCEDEEGKRDSVDDDDDGSAEEASVSSKTARRKNGKEKLVDCPDQDENSAKAALNRHLQQSMMGVDPKLLESVWSAIPSDVERGVGSMLAAIQSENQNDAESECADSDDFKDVAEDELSDDGSQVSEAGSSQIQGAANEAALPLSRRVAPMRGFEGEHMWITTLPRGLPVPLCRPGLGLFPDWLHPAFHVASADGQPRPSPKLLEILRRAIEQTRNDRRYWPIFFAHTFGPIVYRSRRQAMEQTIGVVLERYEQSLLSLAHSNANYRQRRQEQERDALYLCNKDEFIERYLGSFDNFSSFQEFDEGLQDLLPTVWEEINGQIVRYAAAVGIADAIRALEDERADYAIWGTARFAVLEATVWDSESSEGGRPMEPHELTERDRREWENRLALCKSRQEAIDVTEAVFGPLRSVPFHHRPRIRLSSLWKRFCECRICRRSRKRAKLSLGESEDN